MTYPFVKATELSGLDLGIGQQSPEAIAQMLKDEHKIPL